MTYNVKTHNQAIEVFSDTTLANKIIFYQAFLFTFFYFLLMQHVRQFSFTALQVGRWQEARSS